MSVIVTADERASETTHSSSVRVHQYAASAKNLEPNRYVVHSVRAIMKVHVLVDGRGLPRRLHLTSGQVHVGQTAAVLLAARPKRAVVLADKGYASSG